MSSNSVPRANATTDHETIRLADEKLLASLGYKQEFKRAFTPLEVFGIAFSIIGLLPSIGSVLFYATGNGGGPAMVWGWAVASIFILFVGMSMAELASAAPTSGGLYYWTYSLSSPRWRNLLCWIVGYSNTIGSISAVASIDWAAAIQVMAAANIGSDGNFEATSAQTFGVYAAILFTHTLVCCLGTTILARLQTVYVILNILLCVVVIIALPAATAFKNSAAVALGKFENLNGWPDGYAFILSFLAPLWTICSFDSAVHISEEAGNAATAVPWAIVCAIGIAGVLGWAINMSLAFCMGANLEALNDSDQPMAVIFLNSFGVCSLFPLATITYAFSRDGALPYSNWLYRMSKTTGTPVNTVIFDASMSLIIGLLVFAGPQAINAVFAISVTALYVAYAIPIVARFTGKNEFKPGPFTLGVFSLPVAIISVLFMMFMGIVFLFPINPQTNEENMNYTIVVFGGVLLLSLMWYYAPVVGGVHWFKGPVANIVLAEADNDSEIQESEAIPESETKKDED
ncbi:gaba permease [Favolaschia claudopus]|uniref:Gaba permease n=1 Tax=Favolaschia claudopus TaxID=2862362 RepID=A0AAW0DTQ7_9AGAR